VRPGLHTRSARLRGRHKREGAALLIVLFVLMLATGTAVFALQSTQFEQRAAGSLQQAMRTKYIAEAATVSVLGLCLQMGTTGCTDIKRATTTDADEATRRQRFALPNYDKVNETEVLYELTARDFAANAATSFPINVLPLDSELYVDGTSGAASPYRPSFNSLVEKWEVPNPGETRQRYRLIVSTYGQLTYDTDNDTTTAEDVSAANEFRGAHESISATRAFFDVR